MINIQSGVDAINKPTFLFRNVFTDHGGTLTTAGSGVIENALDGNTYDFWQTADVTDFLTVTIGSAQSADTLCIAAHNLGDVSARVRVFAGATAVADYSPTDNSPIMIAHPTASNVEWTVLLTNLTDPAQIGVIMLGERLTFATGITGDYVPTNWGGAVDILGGETLSGQFLGQRVIRRGGETRITPGLMDRDWWTANGDPLRQHYDEGKPFFFAGGPSLFPNDIAYCWRPERAQEMRPAYSNGGYVALGFDVNFYA